MKKVIICVMMIIVVMSFVGCGSTIKVGPFASKYYNGDEYDDAVNEVFNYFSGFEGCEMTEIHYAGDDAVKEEADRRGMSCDQVMVLKSTFKTDGEDHKSSLEPNSTYEDYSWILTRTFHEEQWTVEDHGY